MSRRAPARAAVAAAAALAALALLVAAPVGAQTGPAARHPAARHPAARHPAPPADRWVGADKLKHYFAAFFVQSLGYSVARATGAAHGSSLQVASATTAIVSVGKEWHDRRTTGVSLRDLAWDAAGAGAATLLLRRTAR